MKTSLFLLLVSPMMAFAQQEVISYDPPPAPNEVICGQLSEADCFSKPVDSICMKDPQKGQAGFCHARETLYDQQIVTCDCY